MVNSKSSASSTKVAAGNWGGGRPVEAPEVTSESAKEPEGVPPQRSVDWEGEEVNECEGGTRGDPEPGDRGGDRGMGAEGPPFG